MGGEPVGIDEVRDVVHHELDALKVVERYFAAHLAEFGGRLVTVAADVQDGEARFPARLAELHHIVIEIQIAREDQSADRSLKRSQRDGGDDIVTIAGVISIAPAWNVWIMLGTVRARSEMFFTRRVSISPA